MNKTRDAGKITAVLVNAFDHFILWAQPRKIRRDKRGRFIDEHGEEYIVVNLDKGQRVYDDLRGLRVDEIEDISFWCRCHRIDIEEVRAFANSRLR